MRNLSIFLSLLLSCTLVSQTYEEVKNRFDKYLNYKGSLDKCVEITPTQVTLYSYSGGKKEVDLAIAKKDWCVFAALYKSLPADSVEEFYRRIKNKTAFKSTAANSQSDCLAAQKPLEKVKIMIDPGHMAGNLAMAHIEQKYLHFTREKYPALKQDSLDIAEGMLTWQTASILKKMLEEKGATVAFTRKENGTSFGKSYNEWFKDDKERTLDSLFALGRLTAQKHKWLWKMNRATFFLEFFKDYELLQRSRIINAYHPDLTVIIHYNVNEKNVPWQKPSDKDFCMAFVPGCLTADNLESVAGKMNFLRLLLTTDVNKSEQVSGLLVNELNKQLNVPIAKTSDATYLSEHCLGTNLAGVYCRNLALCRLAQSPLMYGECLYQDDEKECYQLIDNSENKYGVQTNKRVVQAAQAFYNAIVKFYGK